MLRIGAITLTVFLGRGPIFTLRKYDGMIELWSLGKPDKKELAGPIAVYLDRLKHYTKFEVVTIDNKRIPKNTTKEQILEAEVVLIESRLHEKDILVVLDENGKEFGSLAFSEKLNRWMNRSPNRIIFLIGGSYGVAESLRKKAHAVISLSQLTFPHQLVRLLFCEQLYRAFTILKNEKYHHE
jgi:23S rRNA (pseudouridine1915-N3)-methyltransferase